jgi:lysyl-tRNA synthetase class 2
MATEDELIGAREAHAKNELGDDRTAWFPNWLRPTPESEALRAELVRDANDPARVAEFKTEEELDDHDPLYPLWGRVVSKRGPFVVIQTPYGRAQAYFSKEAQKQGLKGTLKRTDLGDHVWVEGRRIRTRTGDAALGCAVLRHVGKALVPPPEKWHGLKDVEKRYRERYVDLFANPEVAEVFRARSAVIQALRRFHDERQYLEVETPMLHTVRGGATARPFTTHHNALDLDLYLRIAPELYLKRLVVGGYDRVYEIGRNFRNEGISTRHNPEFTMLECYTAYATYEDLLDLVTELLRSVDAAVETRWPGRWSTDRAWTLSEDFQRVTMRRALVERLERAGRDGIPETPWASVLDEKTVYDHDAVDAACARMLDHLPSVQQKQLSACESAGERIFVLYELLVEEHLTRMYRTADGSRSVPVFVTEYPFEVSPLARRNDSDPRFTDRFEVFVDGRELANGFSELNDPEDQAARFRAQVEAAQRGAQETMDYDADYVRALMYGMPPAAGYGLGVDRLVMLLCAQPSIRDVLLFPTLRPEAE